MFNIESIKKLEKEAYYPSMILFAQGLMEGEQNLIANLANIASLLYHSMADINWAGFYLLREDQLVLGPFHGKPACIRIQLGKGVCGTCAKNNKTLIVGDVHEFPGHIACDGETNSEIVIPIYRNGLTVGVLDIDSPLFNRFNETDQRELETLVDHIINQCDWEV